MSKYPTNVKIGDGVQTDEFLKICNYFCPNAEIILEIGANDSRDIIKYIEKFKNSKGYAFEIIKEWVEKSHVNIKNANLEGRIKLLRVAISDKDNDEVEVIDYGGGLSSMRKRSSGLGQPNWNSSNTEKLLSRRIDTISNELGIESIDIAKIDVEGCSYEALEGFGDMLNKTKMIHVETEVVFEGNIDKIFIGQKLHEDVYNLLIEYNFKEVLVRQCGGLPQFDSVFVNTNLIEKDKIDNFMSKMTKIDEENASNKK